jgi:hypothetical protein
VFAGTGQAFGGLDYIQAIHQVTMAQPGSQGTQSVTEIAGRLALPHGGRRPTGQTARPAQGPHRHAHHRPQGRAYPLALDAAGPHQYTFAGDEDPNAAGQQVWMSDISPPTANSPSNVDS